MDFLNDRPFAPRGALTLRGVRGEDVVLTWGGDNLVVRSSKAVLARLVAGVDTAKPLMFIGFGTSGETASPDDTGLTDPVYVKLDEPVFPTAGEVRFPFTFPENQANGMLIREFGLLDEDKTLFARKVRSHPIAKVDLALVGEWTVEF